MWPRRGSVPGKLSPGRKVYTSNRAIVQDRAPYGARTNGPAEGKVAGQLAANLAVNYLLGEYEVTMKN